MSTLVNLFYLLIFAALQEAYAHPVQHPHHAGADKDVMGPCAGHPFAGRPDSKEDGGLLQRKGRGPAEHVPVPTPAHEL